jgi:hypothetical protein
VPNHTITKSISGSGTVNEASGAPDKQDKTGDNCEQKKQHRNVMRIMLAIPGMHDMKYASFSQTA